MTHISKVDRGLACRCFCVSCGKPLIARKGEHRTHHFAHADGSECVSAMETALHLMAKDILANISSIQLPPYDFSKCRKTKTGTEIKITKQTARGGEASIEASYIEKKIDDITPDVTLFSNGKSLLVEIAVTHKVDRLKLRKFRHLGLPVIEINLSQHARNCSREELEKRLKIDIRSKKWLFHPSQRAVEKEFLLNYRAEVIRQRKIQHLSRRQRTSSAGAMKNSHAPLLSVTSGSSWSLHHDREIQKFHRSHGRYPTLEETRKLSFQGQD